MPFQNWSRREVLGAGIGAAVMRLVAQSEPALAAGKGRLLFTSAGRTGLIEARKGAQARWLEFSVPEQVTWQPGGFLPDGRILFLSMEARRDGPGRPFDE